MSERLSQEQVLMHAMTLCHENVGEETAHRMASELLLARAVVEAARAACDPKFLPLVVIEDRVKPTLRAYDEGARDA